MEDKIYTVKELQEYLKISRKTILGLLRSGKIKAIKVGREWRVLQSELEKYLKGFDN